MDVAECLCVRCARHGKTCCQGTDIFVTRTDIERIGRQQGSDNFHELRAPSDPAYAQQDDDPVWARSVFRPDGTRRVLKRLANGDCTFLTTQGCELPQHVRPLICRLQPYQYTATGITDERAPECPTHLLRPGENVIEAIHMNLDQARVWHAELYQELQQENVESVLVD